ncbi:MAG: hypothetical protein DRQ40_03885 [Gammaproteobacteria bacterium]|nr:MAG: hypothetical protein DRQ40_03885 [Gammaproteobacteria bacterium]
MSNSEMEMEMQRLRASLERAFEENRKLERINSEMEDAQTQARKIMRQHVWSQAWFSTASAANCTKVESATRYADVCLEEFNERFGY